MANSMYVQLQINPALADINSAYNAAVDRYHNAIDNVQAYNYRSGEVIYDAKVNMAYAEMELNKTPLIVPVAKE